MTAEVLPAVESLGQDVKVEPFGPTPVALLRDLSPSLVFADCALEPERAFRVLFASSEIRRVAPVVGVLAAADLGRLPWHEVLDDVVSLATSPEELRLRIAHPHRQVR